MKVGGRHGAKPLDTTSLRELFASGKAWSAIGVVRARDGSNSHFEQRDGDVLIDVDLSPDGQPAWCRLGSGFGAWRIPKVGTEVGVLVTDGDIRHCPIVVCVLSTEGVDDDLDGDIYLVVNDKKVRIKSTGEDVEVEAGAGKFVKLGGGSQKVARGDLVDAELAEISTAIAGVGGSYTPAVAGTGAQNVKVT